MAKRRRLVLVEWLDACGTSEEVEVEHIEHKPYITESVGFQLKRDKAGITIAMDTYPDNVSCAKCYAFIPKGMIVKVHTLSLAEPSKKQDKEEAGTHPAETSET